jgi:4-amino-4-deoxy-L-arabinose transferase-like glycosyltransferase
MQQQSSISGASRLKLAIKANKWRLSFLAFAVFYAYLLTLNLGYMSPQWDEMPHLFGGLLLVRGQTHTYLTTYGYYPPLFDLLTTGYMQIIGITTAAGRLVSVTFALLAIWGVFELGTKMYGPKNALLASILLGTTPGFFWVSRVTMLETILIFFFTALMFVFYSWLTKNNFKALVFSGIVLGIGILAKYQMAVAAVAMALSVLVLSRKRLKINLAKLIAIFVIAILVVAPWFLLVYQIDGQTKFQTITSVLESGSQNTPAYSNRFFIPVYYLVELTSPFQDIAVHPISIPIMILGLAGLGLFAYRRKKQDIFLLTWFLAVYVFFTVIPNRQWRYVDSVFPILAISAAGFLIFLYGKIRSWQPMQINPGRIPLKKLATALFIFLAASTILYSANDAYQMTIRDETSIPIAETTAYLASHLDQNLSAVLVCSFNLLDQDMFRFYLPATISTNRIWQYPSLAVDAYTIDFNITQFINLCEQRNVKYLILYDYGSNTQFYNTTLTYAEILQIIYNTGRFGVPTDQPFFGQMPNRLFLVRFNQTQT